MPPGTKEGYALFDTDVGPMGVAWNGRGIRRVLLPDASPERLEERLAREAPAGAAAPPAKVARAIELLRRHLAGERVRLDRLRVDLDGVPPFHRRVYEAARRLRSGETVSYGELAARAGAPGAARAVGQAMARNPLSVVVPCHRILSSGGKPGGFSAHGGLGIKARLLAIEGVVLERRWNRAAAVRLLSRADRRMGSLIREIGPYRLRVSDEGGPYESLLRAIVYQQLTGKAAKTILDRVRALFDPARYPTPEEILGAGDADLRGAGLSRAKVAAVRDLAARTLDGTVPSLAMAHAMEDEEIIARLTEVRGVGRWTVEMLLIFRLGRPDVLPVDDYAVRKGFAAWYRRDEPRPREFAEFGQRWGPYRTVASWYFWRASERFAGSR